MKYVARLGDQEREYWFERRDGRLFAHRGDDVLELDVVTVGDGLALSLLVDGRSYDIVADVAGESVTVQLLGERFHVHVEDERERLAHAVGSQRAAGRRELRAAMPGIVVEVNVAVGDRVTDGQALVVLEAMKMQNPLCAEGGGVVTRVVVERGAAVAANALLVELE